LESAHSYLQPTMDTWKRSRCDLSGMGLDCHFNHTNLMIRHFPAFEISPSFFLLNCCYFCSIRC
jgi:hypothetical protein